MRIMHDRFVAAMNVPGGGKNDIPNRLKRQFAIFYVPPPSPVAVNTIFGALVQASPFIMHPQFRSDREILHVFIVLNIICWNAAGLASLGKLALA